ncbi:hypothetical protein [Bacillus thuringiensis]|uniref:hypothetical protein n=1 Tax=Bacillus thuringiensis TaxID=1428 RepID=UPI000B43465C|nr:hypothetical protein [Bacillus thuringiensis]OUA16673.1 hypothetical protein BK776_30415 [Bacillus thuringiensis serovar aizawai]
MTEEMKLNEQGVYQRFSAMNPDMISFAKLAQQYLEIDEFKKTRTMKFSKDDVRTWLENPYKNQDKLIEASRYLYTFSPQYNRLVQYFSNLLMWAFIIEPYDIDADKMKSNKVKIMKDYNKAIRIVENMNIRHEFSKIMRHIMREDVFYGYEHEVGNSYYIQKLPTNYCRISAVEDGAYSFEFDFSYFDGRKGSINLYADEFKEKYALYKRDKMNRRWQNLETYKTICIKANADLEFALPPFYATFESIYDIDIAKKMRDTKEELGNYKVMVQKLPMRKDSDINNDFAIDYETMMQFHNQVCKVVPKQVGVITSPMEIDEFKFEEQKADSDKIAKTERDLFNGFGVSQALFNAEKLNAGSLAMSIKTDEMIVFNIARQFERWLNRKLKNRVKNFKATILDVTYFNKDEVFESALKAAQFGMPTASIACATQGITQSSMLNLSFLENEVLNLHDKLVPLASSHTQSKEDGQKSDKDNQNGNNDPNDEGGRPEKKDIKRSGNGESMKDNNKEYK